MFWPAFKISLLVEQFTATSFFLQILIAFSLCFSTSKAVFQLLGCISNKLKVCQLTVYQPWHIHCYAAVNFI